MLIVHSNMADINGKKINKTANCFILLPTQEFLE